MMIYADASNFKNLVNRIAEILKIKRIRPTILIVEKNDENITKIEWYNDIEDGITYTYIRAVLFEDMILRCTPNEMYDTLKYFNIDDSEGVLILRILSTLGLVDFNRKIEDIDIGELRWNAPVLLDIRRSYSTAYAVKNFYKVYEQNFHRQ